MEDNRRHMEMLSLSGVEKDRMDRRNRLSIQFGSFRHFFRDRAFCNPDKGFLIDLQRYNLIFNFINLTNDATGHYNIVSFVDIGKEI